MSKCQECKCNSDTTSSTEFNKNLCDDCYTEYRVTIQHMFGLKDLYDVDDLLRYGLKDVYVDNLLRRVKCQY